MTDPLAALDEALATPRELPPPSAPMEVARELIRTDFADRSGALTLRHWRGGWWRWRTSRWIEVEQRAMAAAAYTFTEHAVYRVWDERKKEELVKPWTPNRHKVNDLLDALAAVVHLAEEVSMPSWLAGAQYDGLIVSTANGLLDVGRRELLAHTPTFWNGTSVPFDYDPKAGPPHRWLTFMGELWPDDDRSPDALQEWFGYVVSGRLDLHKIALLVGPTRAGKGVTARILGALVGTENVAGPTLSSLNHDFGLAPLLGKTLAVVSDARLNGRNANVVVERLLSISGEDTLTVNRKYREQWTGTADALLERAPATRGRFDGDRRALRAAAAHPLVAWTGRPSARGCAPRGVAGDPELVTRRARTARRARTLHATARSRRGDGRTPGSGVPGGRVRPRPLRPRSRVRGRCRLSVSELEDVGR